jgi:pilus assembly protein CpaF
VKLNQRLKQAGLVPPDEPPAAPTERSPRKPAPAPATRIQSPAPKSGDAQAPGDPLTAIKQRAQESLFTRLGGRLFRPDMTEEQLHHLVIEELGHVLKADRAPLSPAERQRLVDDISEDVRGTAPSRASSPTPR